MNQYRHSKSSLFLMEIILNILFFRFLQHFVYRYFSKDTSSQKAQKNCIRQ